MRREARKQPCEASCHLGVFHLHPASCSHHLKPDWCHLGLKTVLKEAASSDYGPHTHPPPLTDTLTTGLVSTPIHLPPPGMLLVSPNCPLCL